VGRFGELRRGSRRDRPLLSEGSNR
jgi:hypothetical protein